VDGVLLRFDSLDLAEAELDPLPELLRARATDRVRRDKAEGDEEQIGLIDVAIVSVDDRDRGIGVVAAPELVGDQGAAGTGAEDEDSLRDRSIMPDRTGSE
jgi:hypothetical protein